jgi:hypothetical protein
MSDRQETIDVEEVFALVEYDTRVSRDARAKWIFESIQEGYRFSFKRIGLYIFGTFIQIVIF